MSYAMRFNVLWMLLLVDLSLVSTKQIFKAKCFPKSCEIPHHMKWILDFGLNLTNRMVLPTRERNGNNGEVKSTPLLFPSI